jgi:hypothetical protein
MAYIIMGHGEELRVTKVVPKGCILVVQVHSGEVNEGNGELSMNIINDPEKHRFLDPVANYKHVVETINKGRDPSVVGKLANMPVAIYREGDEYPDFKYTLLASNFAKLRGGNMHRILDSGIARYPFTDGVKTGEKYIKNKFNCAVHSSCIDISGNVSTLSDENIFIKLFEKSFYPPMAMIRNWIQITPLTDDASPRKTIANIIITAKDPEKNTGVYITQSELFEKVERNEDGFVPAVFYNLVCRSLNKRLLVQDRETGATVLNNRYRALVGPNKKINWRKSEFIQGIGEAAKQRAPFIGNLQKNVIEANTTGVRLKDLEVPRKNNLLIEGPITKNEFNRQQKHERSHVTEELNAAWHPGWTSPTPATTGRGGKRATRKNKRKNKKKNKSRRCTFHGFACKSA